MKNLIRNKGRLFNVANALNFEIFSKTESLFQNLTHPIILLGLLTQIVLLTGVFYQKLKIK